MTLKSRFLLFIALLLVIVFGVTFVYSHSVIKKINEDWSVRFVKKQIVFDKSRILSPILRDLALVKQLSTDPALLDMALHEDDPEKVKRGIAALASYRTKFQDRSYFVAFTASQNYYFDDEQHRFDTLSPVYRLAVDNRENRWFFKTITHSAPYFINIDYDKYLNVTKVWINYQLKVNDQIVGVVGTGFSLDSFLKDSVALEQEGIRNICVDQSLAIQLDRNKQLINYASLTARDEEKTNLSTLLDNPQDIQEIKSVMQSLVAVNTAGEVRTLWVTYEGKQQLLAMTYLGEIGWFSLTLIDTNELRAIHQLAIWPTMMLLLFVLLLVIALVVTKFVFTPIEQLKQVMIRAQKQGYATDFAIMGSGEIAELAGEFQKLSRVVCEHKKILAQALEDRTAELFESCQQLNMILDTVEAFIYIKDKNYQYVYANRAVQKLLNKGLDAIVGQQCEDFFDPLTIAKTNVIDKQVIEQGERIESEMTVDIPGHGSRTLWVVKIPLHKEDGEVYGLCSIATDITERIKVENTIKNMAFYDSLTSLPNRRLLDERLSQFLSASKRNHDYGALLFIDLDHFKPLNDQHGHKAGDSLLIDVAARLLRTVRETDTVARLGGDEFIVILGDLGDDLQLAQMQVMKVAQKILATVAAPYHIHLQGAELIDVVHFCSASIGVALFNHDENNKERVMQRADAAMYQAKANGRNQIVISDSL